jgi:hypothetical protein
MHTASTTTSSDGSAWVNPTGVGGGPRRGAARRDGPGGVSGRAAIVGWRHGSRGPPQEATIDGARSTRSGVCPTLVSVVGLLVGGACRPTGALAPPVPVASCALALEFWHNVPVVTGRACPASAFGWWWPDDVWAGGDLRLDVAEVMGGRDYRMRVIHVHGAGDAARARAADALDQEAERLAGVVHDAAGGAGLPPGWYVPGAPDDGVPSDDPWWPAGPGPGGALALRYVQEPDPFDPAKTCGPRGPRCSRPDRIYTGWNGQNNGTTHRAGVAAGHSVREGRVKVALPPATAPARRPAPLSRQGCRRVPSGPQAPTRRRGRTHAPRHARTIASRRSVGNPRSEVGEAVHALVVRRYRFGPRQEPERTAGLEQELRGARPDVPGGDRDRDGGRAEPLKQAGCAGFGNARNRSSSFAASTRTARSRAGPSGACEAPRQRPASR